MREADLLLVFATWIKNVYNLIIMLTLYRLPRLLEENKWDIPVDIYISLFHGHSQLDHEQERRPDLSEYVTEGGGRWYYDRMEFVKGSG